MPSFLGGKSPGAFGQSLFFLAGIRRTIVAFEKDVSLKVSAYLGKQLFDIGCNCSKFQTYKKMSIIEKNKLEKKGVITINGKKRFKRILSCLFGGRREARLRNLPSRTSSLLCSAAKQKHFVNQKL